MKAPSNLPPGVTDAAIERHAGVTSLDASRRARDDADAAIEQARLRITLTREFELAELYLARVGLALDMRGFRAAPPIEPIDDMLKRSKGDRARRHVANALNELRIARQFLTAPTKPTRPR